MAGTKYTRWLAVLAVPVFAGLAWLLWPEPATEVPRWPSDAPDSSYSTIGKQWQQPAGVAENPTGNAREAAAKGGDTADHPDSAIDLDQLQHALAHIGVDQQGALVFDEVALASLRRAFDEFGALSDPAMLDQLKLYIEAGLAGDTGAQAASLLDDYFRYRQARTSAEADWDRQQTMEPRERLERLAELRRQQLGPVVANQLYAGEQAHQRYLMALRELGQNPDLSDGERQALRAQLRKDLRDGKLLVDDRGTDAIRQLDADHERWQAQGLEDDTRRYLQDQTLGLVSARSLATTEQQRRDWQQRYDQFNERRRTILSSGLTDAEKVRQIDELLENHFSGDELEASRNYLPPHMRE